MRTIFARRHDSRAASNSREFQSRLVTLENSECVEIVGAYVLSACRVIAASASVACTRDQAAGTRLKIEKEEAMNCAKRKKWMFPLMSA